MNNTAIATYVAAGVALVLAGCSASGTNPKAPSSQANLAANVLQLNVGTANLFGDVPASAVTGTNVAVTYRQPGGALNPGASGTLVNSPSLTVPNHLGTVTGTQDAFLATIVTGPAPAEAGTSTMTATPQTPNAANVTTFGSAGGAFGLGIEPFNYGTVNGVPDNVVPYQVPLYDALSAAGTDPNAFIPGGGPPAFNIAGNTAATLAGFNAISEGLDVFELAPAIGTYTLSVSVPANTGTVNTSATAALSSAALLPAIAPAVPVVSGAGGATLTYVLPAGVSEAYIQVVDLGPTVTGGVSCVGASAKTPVYYTIEATASGSSSLPAGSLCSAAANTTATGSASDGDEFTVQSVGFDYPAYEASYPNSLGKPAPTLTGTSATHQADITISSQAIYTEPAAGGIVRIQTKLRAAR